MKATAVKSHAPRFWALLQSVPAQPPRKVEAELPAATQAALRTLAAHHAARRHG
jgi:hypothetical protein